MYEHIHEELIRFIDASPTAYHAVSNLCDMLEEASFTPLREEDAWALKAGGRYYVTRNGSALIAFCIPQKTPLAFHIAASHADSPVFKIKANPEMPVLGAYVRLNVERYGGMLMLPWFDRPLSVAGRLIVKDKKTGGFKQVTVNVDRDLLIIPNLAIHFDREANKGHDLKIQQELLPLYGDETRAGTFFKEIAKAAGVRPSDIVSHDLFVYPRQKGTLVGAEGEYIVSPRLDDLQCTYADARGFLDAAGKKGSAAVCPVLAVFDNEEVGSSTRQGADAGFLSDTLRRIALSLRVPEEDYLRALAASFLISADNAHAVHPAHTDKSDPVNRPVMNKGIVIKHSANQKYTTDAASCAVMKELCEKAQIPCQEFVNHADILGGSTLGNLSLRHVGVRSVDIGCAQLAMHSPCETAGRHDTAYLARVMKVFFESDAYQPV